MGPNSLPDTDLLRELFAYNPKTGELTRKARPRRLFKTDASFRMWNSRWANTPVTAKGGAKYLVVTIQWRDYYAHRIIYKIIYGHEPPAVIDHKNGNGLDNSIDNLRCATQSQNMMNKTWQSNSKTQLKGVSFRKDTRRYTARIRATGKYLSLGCYDSPEAAHAAYKAAALRLHGDFASP